MNEPKIESGMTLKNRIILQFFILCNTILLVFLCNMVLNLGRDVANLEHKLATKQDVANVKVGDTDLFYQDRCTACHTERKFMQPHSSQNELVNALKKMEQIPEAHMTEMDVNRLHASLVVEKCVDCHSRDILKTLSLKTKTERLDIITQMQKKQGQIIVPEVVEDISRSLEVVFGF